MVLHFIYKMFGASAEAISGMVAASAVAATVTTLLIGALSDKIGKRKLFMCSGYILWGISIFGFVLMKKDLLSAIFTQATSIASVGITLTIGLDCLMTFFGSTANDAAFNAWLTDVTEEKSRGAVEGVNAMMPMLAILAVFGGFMAFDLDRAESWTLIFAIIGGVVICVGIAGLFLIDESNIRPTTTGYFENLCYGFRPSTARKNRELYIMLLVFALFNISIQTYMPYLILYYEVSLGMANYVLIMAPAIILASVFTVIWGRVHDKVGFRASMLPSLGLLCAGYILLYFFRSTALVFVGSLLMMCGYLAGTAVFGAVIRDHTPEGRAGMFQGLRIAGQVLIPGVIGPAIGAKVLANAETVINSDGTESFIPNANIFLAAFIAAIVIFVALIPVFRAKKTEK